MGTNTEDAEEEVLANALDKRNLAALAKNNFFPREYKRSQDTGNFHIKTMIMLLIRGLFSTGAILKNRSTAIFGHLL